MPNILQRVYGKQHFGEARKNHQTSEREGGKDVKIESLQPF
jgi:hypothetical protein